jgi:glycosyltransferase involved in cell wall biosynthesis
MKIAFYAPFKPLDHDHPSGDLAIARGLVQFLEDQGHTIEVQSRLRARWIYFKPWLWPVLAADALRSLKHLYKHRPAIWLTYHTYYKAPDLLGPLICKLLGVKYIIFQGIYSTKQKRRMKTILGFYLNRYALKAAHHIFTNKGSDFKNLQRLIPGRCLTYVRPGIIPRDFMKDEQDGRENRKTWGLAPCPTILTAAMFRDDVKTKGLAWLIQCCAKLPAVIPGFHLVIAGSGKMEDHLKALAQRHIPGHYTFVGKIDPKDMAAFYSSGDVFAFPGIRESLGMVYLEAQACGLPVVAFKNGGIPEVVQDKKTGFLVPMYDGPLFFQAIKDLLQDPELRHRMGNAAMEYIRAFHDRNQNYKTLETLLVKMGA